MQARPEAARDYGLDVLRRATGGIASMTAVHICFGYAAIIYDRPSGYSFMPEPAATVRPGQHRDRAVGLALDVLDALRSKTTIFGVLDLSSGEVETPETVADRIPAALAPIGRSPRRTAA